MGFSVFTVGTFPFGSGIGRWCHNYPKYDVFWGYVWVAYEYFLSLFHDGGGYQFCSSRWGLHVMLGIVMSVQRPPTGISANA